MEFRYNLKHLRERAGYTASSFVEKAGIKYNTYIAYENSNREPKFYVLKQIATVLGVSIDELLGYGYVPQKRKDYFQEGYKAGERDALEKVIRLLKKVEK